MNRFLFYVVSIFISVQGFGQNSLDVVQFSGLVVGGDSLFGIPGVLIYIPKAGRGTNTNEAGYFSMPTLAGDTAVVQALGYKKKKILVPKSDRKSVTLIIELQEDTVYLPIVDIFPYPTEEIFKKAFLDLKLDERGYSSMRYNLNEQTLMKMLSASSMSSSENQKYSIRNQMNPGTGPNGMQGFQLLSPFAWSSLVKTVRRNKQKYKDSYRNE
ncbi:MAG: carboxypeptidase-like regulatory domain-containing protein [Bacteroidetes bacterium]|nr:MAG: carboxypeptidase-like regulatory domain-containing protein [Bacteroidota bacterium]